MFQIVKVLFLISPLLTGIETPLLNIEQDTIDISTTIIGPYKINQNCLFNLNIKGYESKDAKLKFMLTGSNDIYKDITLYTTQFINYPKGSTHTFTINLDNGLFTLDKLTYGFYVFKDNMSNIIYKENVELTRFENKTIDLTNMENRRYITPCYSFKIKNCKVLRFIDDYDFNLIEPTLYSKNYHTFPFDKLLFNYIGQENVRCDYMTLSFQDKDNLFPNLHINDTHIFFPLTTTLIGNKYQLVLKDSMFVNPKTMDLSFHKIPGYVATNNLYLPINGYSKIKTYKFNLDLVGLGYQLNNFHYQLSYDKEKNLIGECQNSDYCIISGVSHD